MYVGSRVMSSVTKGKLFWTRGQGSFGPEELAEYIQQSEALSGNEWDMFRACKKASVSGAL